MGMTDRIAPSAAVYNSATHLAAGKVHGKLPIIPVSV